ncbi:hypothetical protein [Desulfuromonas thiophila]|uniref:hypothetical protein n=1 Tax=Desulfuromonas thiophila TaxID=57664 RepID=UPI0029F4FB81|nr:hypothetical protein [Desulfuromonas thiophila]
MTADREQILRAVLENARAAVQHRPSRENLADYSAAADALEQYLNRSHADQSKASLKSEAAAVAYLTGQGYKIGKTKFNADVNRRLVAKTGGAFTAADLNEYAIAADLPRLDVAADNAPSTAEGVKVEQQRHLRLKNDITEGLYTLTADIEQMLSSRAATLKAGWEQFWRDHAAEIIRRVSDGMTCAELIEYGLELTEEHLDQYAQDADL